MSKKPKDKILGTPHRRTRFFSGVKWFLKLFRKKPQIINLAGNIEDKAIYISNHSGSSGPFNLELFFPKYFIPWGTFEMRGGYRERWKYMYNVYFRQKKKVPAFFAFFAATFAALFTKMFYRGMKLIPTYGDARMISTIKYSVKLLDEARGILIFPENSSDGYKPVLEEYLGGFVLLSKIYYSKTGEDLPVYTVYWDKKTNKLVIDKPAFCNALLKAGKTIKQVAEHFKNKTNELRSKYITHEMPVPTT